MIIKELTLRRKNSEPKSITQRNIEKWKNITDATSRLITYLLITRKEF